MLLVRRAVLKQYLRAAEPARVNPNLRSRAPK